MPTPSTQPGAPGRAPPERWSRCLARNLAALERVDPELAERLRWPVDGSRVALAEDGSATYRLHRRRVRLDVAEPEAFARAALAALSAERAGRERLLLGVGTGELLLPLLADASSSGAMPVDGARLLAWDADPWHLRLALGRHDLARAIAERRLRLLLGSDLLEHAPRALAEVRHPLLADLHAATIATARAGAPGARAVVAAGGLFVDEVRAALERRGWSAWTLDVQRLAQEELARELARLAPRLLFAVNHTEGLAEFCAERGVPLVVWEVDPALAPPRRLPALASSARETRVFTYRERNRQAFAAAGYARVEALPLAADPELRRPLALDDEERERWGAPLAFVGSSMVANALRLREQALAHWSAWLGGGASARARAEAGLRRVLEGQRRTPALDRVAALLEEEAPGLAHALAGRGVFVTPLVAESAAAEKRLAALAPLGALGLSVWGDEGWSALACHGVRWRGSAGHREELTRIYNACAVHLDVARLYQNDIVPMRVFDVLACGGFLLAERSAELERLFVPGRELDTWSTSAELRAKAAHYLAHPDEARAIAARGRAVVLEHHTIERRLERMLAGLEAA